jgi:hypothetical protein
VSISSSITAHPLPNSGTRVYILLSDITTQLTEQYFITGNPQITASWNISSGVNFTTWFTNYVCGGGWDPLNPKSKSVYYVTWQSVLTSAIQYVQPTLTAGQLASSTLTVQIAQALLNDFGNVTTFIAMSTQT